MSIKPKDLTRILGALELFSHKHRDQRYRQ